MQGVHQMFGQIQERVYDIKNKEQSSYRHRPERTDVLGRVYIKCLEKFKSGFTKSKEGTKFLQTQAGMYGYVLYRVYIKCFEKFKTGFTKSKEGTKFLQTQAGMYGYVLYRVYIKCLEKFKSGFTKSKEGTKFLQTQTGM